MRCYGYDCGVVVTRRRKRLGDPWHDFAQYSPLQGTASQPEEPLLRKLFTAGQPQIAHLTPGEIRSWVLVPRSGDKAENGRETILPWRGKGGKTPHLLEKRKRFTEWPIAMVIDLHREERLADCTATRHSE
ncbi:uncharacterized protein CTRU02_205639 [Colletotrichum truncatum]|uniref:Uncharacterized protein n=1 Tax=Colletotrichum truncatum TaxID=5467 RepID=A0ACC3Z4M0_COLTU|nr:uncharacterized protein CTRU02_09392 [Colletotrichum truncatum]KAF6788584.1 hypothetical protein CTRU02_09392 [Colletotrichum truncatum]